MRLPKFESIVRYSGFNPDQIEALEVEFENKSKAYRDEFLVNFTATYAQERAKGTVINIAFSKSFQEASDNCLSVDAMDLSKNSMEISSGSLKKLRIPYLREQ